MELSTGINIKTSGFLAGIFLAILVKLAFISDLSVLIIYSPHDDGLYVSRAFHLLSGDAFGSYDARLLVKFPGISLWLAGSRLIGLPYLLSINLLYVTAGLYFIFAMRCCGFSHALLLAVFILYLFNPVTLSNEWFRPVREPLSTSLLVLLIGAMTFVLEGVRERRMPIAHLALFSVVFGFALLVREEDPLLYGMLFLLAITVLLEAWRDDRFRNNVATWARVLMIIVLPLVTAHAANMYIRSYISEHYGLPIMHDFGEGEFPKLIAAMRSLESRKDNRFVMIPQEALGKLLIEVPRLAPVINRLPPPSSDSFSCQRYGVCSEWANGWMPFWIKDAAFQAGLTPDLKTAQVFFRAARQDIERACREGRLKCRDKGTGLLPPFELRWTRAFFHEWFTLMGMTLVPNIQVVDKMPAIHPVSVDYGRVYQVITRTDGFDTLLQTSRKDGSTTTQFINPLAEWRGPIASFYRYFGFVLAMGGMLAFLIRLRLWRDVQPSTFVYVAAVFTGYAAIRLAALSYVAVYLGRFDSRIIFSIYVVVMLIALLVVADAAKALLQTRSSTIKS